MGRVAVRKQKRVCAASRGRAIRWLVCALHDEHLSRVDGVTALAARELANELLAFLATRPELNARTESEARSRRIRSYAALMRLVAAVPASSSYRSALAELGQLHGPPLAKCRPRRADRQPATAPACRAAAE
jgi:hypothetical protein